ncbi:MAG: translation initiation factor IF-3 [Patescibacteria group bacterium]
MIQLRLRVNEQIRLPQVLLIDETGNRVGVVATADALAQAKRASLDLVEIAPNLRPPVCKIIDYGKYQYEQSKSQSHQNKKNKAREDKEMRLSIGIDEHDLVIKAKRVDQFLAKRHKVKLAVRFKGRQMAHPELGKEIIAKFLSLLKSQYTIEKSPILQGRQLTTVLNPKR